MFCEEVFPQTYFYLNNFVLFAMCFRQILVFILTLLQSFHAVLIDNLGILPRPGKISVVTNSINFFITDCTLNLRIANGYENGAVNISRVVEVNSSLSQFDTKLLWLPHHVVNIRISIATFYVLSFAGIITYILLNK